MSTRTNIVIKKENQNSVQLYHHHDGYPSGVGMGLFEYLNKLSDKKDDVLADTEYLAKYLSSIKDDEYEYEGEVRLHDDIEYLYVIDLDSQNITCYSVWCWDFEGDDNDLVDGKVDDEMIEVLVYSLPMWTTPSEFADVLEKNDF